MDYKPPEPQTSHTGPHYLCSLWSCLSLSLLLSFIQTGQLVKYVTIRVTEELLIFVDDTHQSSISFSYYSLCLS